MALLLVEGRDPGRLKAQQTPAGHLDPGESPEQACAAKCWKKPRTTLCPRRWWGVPQPLRQDAHGRRPYLRFAFAGTLGTHHSWRTLDTGILRTVDDADEIRACPERHRSPLLLACLEDYLAGQRHLLTLVHTDPSVMQAPNQPAARGHRPGAWGGTSQPRAAHLNQR